MAETDTILQLGIEAAREGNREEARNLFNLVTRQDPNNAQGWLWLAGVANGPEERRVALEHVVRLEPNNEMAIRGLQAMGVNPSSVPSTSTASTASTTAPTPADLPPIMPAAPPRNMSAEEQYASELDSAFDDYDTVEKAAPPPRQYESTPVSDTDEPATERVRLQPRRSSTARRDREDAAAQPRPRRWLFLGLVAAIALAVLFLLIIPAYRENQRQTAGVGNGGVAAVPTADGGIGVTNNPGGVDGTLPLTGTNNVSGTVPLTGTEPISGTNQPGTTDPNAAQPGTTDPNAAQPGTTDPNAGQPAVQPPAATDGDLAAANPQPVGIGTQISANNYTFTFPNANYAAVLGNQLGGSTTQGSYVVVLTQVGNTSGAPAALPADYFVLKDAQGRVYTANPQLSNAYIQRGINADLSQTDAIPPGGLLYSVPLIFDVQPGATNLVLFARGNTGQGFQVLNGVP